TGAADRSLDQSTKKGVHLDHSHTRSLSNLLTSGVPKSLTHSARVNVSSAAVNAPLHPLPYRTSAIEI
ncbi:MAG: hypothetical protein ACRD4G_08160, partial [Bryobacteraceae bacterium]